VEVQANCVSWRSRIRYIAVALATFATAAFLLEQYGPALNIDASAFLVVGRGWLAGVPPYSGLWDHKPPAIYELAALASFVGRTGGGELAFKALSAGSVVATALTVDRIVRHLTDHAVAGMASALLTAVLLACPLFSVGGGLTELFATSGMAISLLAVLNSKPGSRGTAFAGGIGLGWAASCSLLSLGVLPALAYVWLDDAGDRTVHDRQKLATRLKPHALSWFMLGGVAACAACWLPIVVSGSFGAGFDAVIGYSSLYRSLAIFEPTQWLGWLAFLLPFWLPAFAVAALIRRDDFPVLLNIATIWLAGSLAWLLYSERLYPHYFLLLTVPAVMLTISGAVRCGNLTMPAARLLTRLMYVALVAAGLLALMANGPASPLSEAATNRAVADYVDAHTAQSDGIYVWGLSPDIYLSSDRMPQGRFFYLLPLMTPGFGEAAADEMLRTWKSHPPTLIVDASFGTANHGAMSPLLVDHPIQNEDRRTGSAALDGLRAFVRDHYEPAVVIGDKRIYRYRG
jgi:hypothetical protein